MSKNALPYYKRFPRDLFEGTLGMPFEEKAAYGLVLDLIYMQGGELPDDPKYIAGMLGLSVRKWNSIRQSLLDRDKLQLNGEFLTNYRAVIELKNLRSFQEKQSENRRGGNKNKDLPEPRSNHGQTNQNQNHISSSSSAREAPDPESWTDDQLLSEVMAAVGIKGPPIPTHWMPPAATIHVGRWRRDLKLDPRRIVDAAKASRARHDEPPNGPKALDGVMRRVAAELTAEPLRPDAQRRGAGPKPETDDQQIARWNRIAAGGGA